MVSLLVQDGVSEFATVTEKASVDNFSVAVNMTNFLSDLGSKDSLRILELERTLSDASTDTASWNRVL